MTKRNSLTPRQLAVLDDLFFFFFYEKEPGGTVEKEGGPLSAAKINRLLAVLAESENKKLKSKREG